MRLTNKDKIEVIKDYAAGKSVTEIAEKFTVSKTAISKILKNGKSLQNADVITIENGDDVWYNSPVSYVRKMR